MPRRVNLTILLGLIIVVMLSFGFSAGARPGDDSAGAEPGSDAWEDGSDGGLGEFEQLRRKAEAADGTYRNALDEQKQLDEEVVKTRNDLRKTEEDLAEAEDRMGERASQVYKQGGLAGVDALFGAKDLSQATEVVELLARQLGRDRSEVKELRKAKDELAQTQQAIESQIQDREQTAEKAAAERDEAQRAMEEARAAFDALEPEEREDIKEESAQRAQEAAEMLRGGAVLEEPKEESGESAGNGREASEAPEELVGGSDEEPAGETGRTVEEDQERQAMVVQAVEETLQELAAEGALPTQGGLTTGEGSEGTPLRNPVAEMAANAAQEKEEAERRAREAADLVVAEQEAGRKAAEQAEAARNAELAAQQVPTGEQSAARAAAEEAQRLANLAAEEAAAQKAAAEQAASQAAGQKGVADQTASQLAAERPNARPTVGGLPLGSTATGVPAGQPALSGSGGGVIGEARTWLGVPYVLGGESRAGLDCAAFTKKVYEKFGVLLGDSPAAQMGQGTPVSRGALQPGDLVFFDETGGRGAPTHVGIYYGNNQVIHASNFTGEVSVTNMNYIPGFIGGRRLL